ncbi:bifunctional 4-hydroxy-2-oxoglutarate aldolase/2-dehydro-3-deoxy-phosphogluconate aldolase [Kitasatospora cineracea]|uniref:bifunctional 4-hydroxy-2-oxoglutarate aldolase/2-dehydro-3-deoxy-phosphogluconate aldolase n=1 Tax=Kitasatospora cineracea TaxID=88074 RepID=UPI003448CFA5
MIAAAETGAARLTSALRRFPAVAILRAATGDHLERAVHALADGGVTAVEITATTPGAFAAVARLRARLDRSVALGVGTVTTPGDLARAADAGSDFVVSPHTDPRLIRSAATLGLGTLPGALTPTEAVAARDAGATAVKLYPAGTLGLGYLKAIRAPLADIPFVPTGSIPVARTGHWLAAGALAVGLGSPLLGDALHTGRLDPLRGNLAELRLAVTESGWEAA